MKSCIYAGQVRHRRFSPKVHRFSYKLFLMYLDLDELPSLFNKYWFWSSRLPNLAWFKRDDHLGHRNSDLSEAVRDEIKKATGVRPQGPVRLLTNLRFFGYSFNPVSFYYCFNADGTDLHSILAEVNNTPWGEQHVYVLPVEQANSGGDRFLFQNNKEFHVSPFMPMDIEYDWRLSLPGEKLSVHIGNFQDGVKIFDASLKLQRQPITSSGLSKLLIRFPLMPFKIVGAIYYEAARLWLKRVPFVSHPDSSEASERMKRI